MPKRRSEQSTVEILSKKLKKLQSEIERCRRPRRRRRLSSSETSPSSSSSCSSRSTSGSRCKSRDPTPSEQRYDRTATKPTLHAPLGDDGSAREASRANTKTAMQAAQIAPGNTSGTQNIADYDALPLETTIEQADTPLDPEILDILGMDPSSEQKYSAEINKDLANRLNHIFTAGHYKEGRKLLIEKYLIPANCINIAAPRLNAEIKAAVPDTVVKRDKAIEARQNEIAAVISCLSQAISSQLLDKDTNHDLLKKFMDSIRILCDIQYSESISRRNFALYSLKREVKEQLTNAKIDKMLFGKDLPETLKTAKAVMKSVSDLKIPKKANPPKNAPKSLNWKTGPDSRRAGAGPARRQPPAAASRPPPRASSSRTLSQPQRSRQLHRR